MPNDSTMTVFNSKSRYIDQLRFEDDGCFRESLVIAALLSQSALQLVLTFTQKVMLSQPEALTRSIDIQWLAVERLTDIASSKIIQFEELYSAILKEGDIIHAADIGGFPDSDGLVSSIGCILELHMFLSKPNKQRLVKAISAFLHQATSLAVHRLTLLGEDVSGRITPEKNAKVDNTRENFIFIDLINWIFEEAAKLPSTPEETIQLRAECLKRSIAVIAEAESLFNGE